MSVALAVVVISSLVSLLPLGIGGNLNEKP
jgi:hypothetical protein